MKSNIWTIMKKEFARFFKDPRMVFSSLILPGLLIFVLYTFMGTALQSAFSADYEQITVYTQHMPASLVFDGVETIETADGDAVRTQIAAQEADLLVVFPADFEAQVAAYDVQAGGAAPNVEIYYNSAATNSSAAHTLVTAALDAYESARSNLFDVNNGGAQYDLASKEDTTGRMFSMMMPLLLMMMLFSGCMAVAAESIAGEKERGTIATLLVTPMRRSALALGKIFSLGIIAVLCGLSSFIGTILSLPSLMGAAQDGMSAAAYNIGDYGWLVLVILSTALLMVSAISVISAFAKSVKEASALVVPLMVVVMLLSVTGMFSGAQTNLALYFVPLYNTVQSMVGLFSFAADPTSLLITCAVNLIFAGGLTALLSRMMNSERVIFSS